MNTLICAFALVSLVIMPCLIVISIFENKIQEKIWSTPLHHPKQEMYGAIMNQLELTHALLSKLLFALFIVPIIILEIIRYCV